eukprot:6638672-Pyramimonas_sp.AAC.1
MVSSVREGVAFSLRRTGSNGVTCQQYPRHELVLSTNCTTAEPYWQVNVWAVRGSATGCLPMLTAWP